LSHALGQFLGAQGQPGVGGRKENLGTPVSEQIRRAIDRYLKQMESRK
jgi:hypothetical protein